MFVIYSFWTGISISADLWYWFFLFLSWYCLILWYRFFAICLIDVFADIFWFAISIFKLCGIDSLRFNIYGTDVLRFVWFMVPIFSSLWYRFIQICVIDFFGFVWSISFGLCDRFFPISVSDLILFAVAIFLFALSIFTCLW